MGSQCGLEEICKPAQDKEWLVQIVFVHGLFGHRRKTWTPSKSAQDGANRDFFWPRHLGEIIPDAQILTWGYDANIDHFLSSASQNTVHQHANNLLSDLVDERERSGFRGKIIFVAHSLGGIVVKDALNKSSTQEGTSIKQIAPSTCGVIFLGTPHRGSKSASLGKYAYEISRAYGQTPNLPLMRSLERNSEVLDRIADDFAQTLLRHDYKICSFREEKEVRKFWILSTMIVDPDSAKIGDGREAKGSIPADHREMAKFRSASDVGFTRVSSKLQNWSKEIRDLLIRSGNDVENLLYSLDSKENRKRIKGVNPAHAVTLRWLFDDSEVPFVQWLRDAQKRKDTVFWVSGKPGSGKSTLMKFALQSEFTQEILGHSWIMAGFFFHDRGSEQQKNLSSLLQELLYQIVRQRLGLFAILRPIYRDLVQSSNSGTPHWDIESLKNAFLEIVKQTQFGFNACLFVDAMDEHGGDNAELIEFIKNLTYHASTAVNIRICIASRPWEIFKANFSACPGLAIDRHTYKDILEYSIETLGAVLRPDEREARYDQIRDLAFQLTSKAAGVFLWVRIVVDELSKKLRDGTPIPSLNQIVSEVPPELKELYAWTMNKIDDEYKYEGHAMLQVVMCSRRPLSIHQLLLCVDISRTCIEYVESEVGQNLPKVTPPDETFEPQELDDMIKRLSSRTGGLLELDLGSSDDTEPTVQFLHQTVKEFTRIFSPEVNNNDHTHKFWREDGLGYRLLMLCGSLWRGQLADDLRRDIFYYAKSFELRFQKSSFKYIQPLLIEGGLVEEELPKHPATLSPSDGLWRIESTGIDWWLMQDEHDGVIRAIKDCLYHESSLVKLFYVALVADLQILLRDHTDVLMGPGPKAVPIDPLQLATVGPILYPELSSHAQRLQSYLPTYATRGFLMDLGKRVISLLRLCPECRGLDGALAVVILNTLFSDAEQNEATRLNLSRQLLAAGASPHSLIWNRTAPFDETDPTAHPILYLCIYQESGIMVQQFLDSGDTIRPIQEMSRRHLYGLLNVLLVRRAWDVLKVLQDHGYSPSWIRSQYEDFSTICKLVDISCCLAASLPSGRPPSNRSSRLIP